MGPVSFESVYSGFERSRLLRAAGVLADAGIRAQLIDGPTAAQGAGADRDGGSLLVRSEDVARARQVLDAFDRRLK